MSFHRDRPNDFNNKLMLYIVKHFFIDGLKTKKKQYFSCEKELKRKSLLMSFKMTNVI